MELNCKTAEAALRQAEAQNPGRWAAHVRFAALACRNIAARCDGLSADTAYCYGLLHDIGRYAGVSSEKHLIDGYRFCMVRGWEKAAQICISHAFMLQDIRTSIGTFDVSDDDYRFMARFVRDAVYDDYDRAAVRRAGTPDRILPSGKALRRRRPPVRNAAPHPRALEEDSGNQSAF